MGKKKVAAAAEGGGHGEGIGLSSAGGFFSFPLSGYDLGPRGTGGVAAPGRVFWPGRRLGEGNLPGVPLNARRGWGRGVCLPPAPVLPLPVASRSPRRCPGGTTGFLLPEVSLFTPGISRRHIKESRQVQVNHEMVTF